MNRVQLEGYIGKATTSGSWLRVSLATSWQGKTTWHDVRIPPRFAVNTKIDKGARIRVDGFIAVDIYETKTGKSKWVGVIAHDVQILRESKADSQPKTENDYKQKSIDELRRHSENPAYNDDDIPF